MTEPIRCRSVAEFAAHITALREGRGYTQLDLAWILGGPQVSVWRWETGHAIPRLDNAIRHATALGYDLALIPRAASSGVPKQEAH